MHRLDISNLRLEYGFKRILWDVFLCCETGKVVGLLGRNGSGKTCLMKAAYGELKLQEQYVGIDGEVLLTRGEATGRYALFAATSFGSL